MTVMPLPPPERAALFLDVDGTLLELAPRPDAVVVTDRTRALLERAERRLAGALALVSGRPLEELDRLFSPLRLPAAGVHGLQRRDVHGREHHAAPPPGWHASLAPRLARFARQHPNVVVEDKGHAIALHYRRAPELAEAALTLAGAIADDMGPETRLLRGKMVLEFMPAGSDKGRAIEAFMGEPPYSARTPVFIGDDVTDEAGFSAVNAMGGVTLRVGTIEHSHARHALPDVAGVHAWLQSWLN